MRILRMELSRLAPIMAERRAGWRCAANAGAIGHHGQEYHDGKHDGPEQDAQRLSENELHWMSDDVSVQGLQNCRVNGSNRRPAA